MRDCNAVRCVIRQCSAIPTYQVLDTRGTRYARKQPRNSERNKKKGKAKENKTKRKKEKLQHSSGTSRQIIILHSIFGKHSRPGFSTTRRSCNRRPRYASVYLIMLFSTSYDGIYLWWYVSFGKISTRYSNAIDGSRRPLIRSYSCVHCVLPCNLLIPGIIYCRGLWYSYVPGSLQPCASNLCCDVARKYENARKLVALQTSIPTYVLLLHTSISYLMLIGSWSGL